MKILFGAILFSLLNSACTKGKNMPIVEQTNQIPSSSNVSGNADSGYNYLALGDSYTIGESVKQAESFPYQLQNLLKNKGLSIATPKIIATTGWTTDELQNAIKKENLDKKFDFVTLLIGVNNQYRGYPISTYKKEFAELLQTAIDFAKGKKERVFVVSIPDWGVTPFGKNSFKSTQAIAEEIDAYNAINQEITIAAGISYTNITPESKNAATDISLIASDGLHPSGKMYGGWSNALFPKVMRQLNNL